MKNKLWITGLMVMVMVLIAGGCTEPKAVDVPRDPEPPAVTSEPAIEVQEPVIPAGISLLNGLPVDETVVNRRPIAVMLDNQAMARPQAGLSEADVVMEILAEGQITRYMAIFQSQDPETIGPVRSARPYYIEKAQEYDAYYVHAGGSMQALSDVVQQGVADLDALHEGKITFWRKNHKKAPHNLYTSPEALRKAASARGYRTDWKGISQQFNQLDVPAGGIAFAQVDLHYKEPGKGDPTGYTSTFNYISESQPLMRSVNGKPHLDETTQKALYAQNLIIQMAKHRVIDSEGRLEVDLIGSGEGYYCRGGKYWEITWEKKRSEAPTTYTLTDGSPLVMKPGILWVEVFPTDKVIEFK